MELGALGSRQTGGGWGGAVISLVPVDQAAAFLDAVKTSYEPYQALDEVELDSNAFITKPGVGAGGEYFQRGGSCLRYQSIISRAMSCECIFITYSCGINYALH